MSRTKAVSIFIAEDHLISRIGLKMLLEQTSHFSVVGESEDGQDAVKQILELKPEVVMMDLGLPSIDGVEATLQVKKALPETKVLIFTTAEDDSSIFAALKAGADGYCLKTISGEMLSMAIESVLKGAAWLDPGIAHKVLRVQTQQGGQQTSENAPKLSDSKLELLALVEKGKSLEEIALELRINDSLVKGLLNELLGQLKGDKNTISNKPELPAAQSGGVAINVGDTVASHYKVEERIGHGGMGAVYRAKHTFIDRTVAIKTLHEHLAAEASILERFKIEAESSAAVTHQNLVSIYDYGLIENKVPYIVMEFLQGLSLEELLEQEGRISELLAIHIFAQVCDALQAVHSKGIVHRDLKPANIMLLKREENPYFVKVVDFGIAKILDSSKKSVTQTGECIGSPLYMSPEQCWGSGKKPLDLRSDLYSLGCVMHELLTGYPLFDGDSFLDVVMKHIKLEPSVARLEDACISARISKLIMDMTQKDPSQRPSSAAAVKAVLLSP